MRRASVCLLVFLLVFSASAVRGVSPGEYDGTIKAAREILWKTLASGGVNSGTVAVLDKGRVVFSEGFGPADRAEGRRVDKETRFNIGSASKMFAAVGILLLVDEGRVGLEDPVVKYLPDFVMKDTRYRDITVRMLFNHSSGLPGSTFVFGYKDDEDHQAVLLETLKDSFLKHDPGAMSIYCNDGFTLAEMIVEKVSGLKFLDFIEARVFEPLGMENTGASLGLAGGKAAEFYDGDGKKYPLEVVPVIGAGGLSSTAEDLCRFADSFMPGGKHILSSSSLEEILKSQPTRFSLSLKGQALLDAFGWDHAWLPDYREKGFQMLGKSGGTAFYSTNLQILPSERMAVAVIYSGQGDAAEATLLIMDALMRDRHLPVPEEKELEKPIEARSMSEDMLPFAGYYGNADSAFRFDLDGESGILNIFPTGGKEPLYSLVHNDGYFYETEKDLRFYFITTDEGTFLVLEKMAVYGADVPVFQKLEACKEPCRMSVEMDGALWLLRNASPFLQVPDFLLMRSSQPEGLPGYVDFYGLKRVVDPDFAEIAATGFRDQSSLTLFKEKGELRGKIMQFVYSPESAAKLLLEGQTRVAIAAEGENEWMKLDSGLIVSFAKPEDARVIVISGNDEDDAIFDSIVDDGEVCVPEGSFVFFAGSPGDTLEIKAR